MRTVPLGEIATFVRGVTFKPSEVSSDGVGVMRTKNVQEVLDLTNVVRIPERLVKRSSQYLQHGDILISSANSWNLVGKACWVGEPQEPLAVGGFVTALRPDTSQVEPRFLYRWFTSPRTQAVLRSFSNKTTSISNLSLTLSAQMPVPLPPLEEQRRIAGILDQADAIRAKRRQVLAHLGTLTQSIFNDMFGLRGSDLHGSDTLPLGDVLSVKSGSFLPAKAQERGPYPVYGGNGVNGRHSEYLFEDSKVVIGRVGAYCGVVHLAPERSWITDNALYVASMRRELSLIYLRDVLVAANLNQYASQSGQPLISASRIKDTLLLVPSIDAQLRYENRVDRIDTQRAVVRRALGADDELFGSLQARAFRGEL